MYYLRMQGRVTGPFTMDKMKALRARGILQPFHELSSDRANWHAASGVADLFPPVATEPVATVASPAPAAQPQAVQGPAWFYLDSRKERCGPVGEEVLPFMIERGEFNKKTLVWTSGMAEWSPASEIFPRLFNQYVSSAGAESSSGSIGKLAWLMQGRALLLLIWPIVSIAPMILLFGSFAASIHGGPLAGSGSSGFKVGVLFQYIFFLAQAGFAIFGALELLRLGKNGNNFFLVAGYSELAATSVLLAVYSVFTMVLIFGLLRDSQPGSTKAIGFLMLAAYTFGQGLAAVSILVRDIALARFAFAANQWVGRHFVALAALAGIMTLNTLVLGIIGVAVLSDDGGGIIEKFEGMAVFSMAFVISYGVGKWFEFHHSLLILPIASSMRNTM
jgi:hypothetical protein